MEIQTTSAKGWYKLQTKTGIKSVIVSDGYAIADKDLTKEENDFVLRVHKLI